MKTKSFVALLAVVALLLLIMQKESPTTTKVPSDINSVSLRSDTSAPPLPIDGSSMAAPTAITPWMNPMEPPPQQMTPITTKPARTLQEDILLFGRLPRKDHHPPEIDVVIPFDGELSPKQLGLLLKQVKGKEHEDALGLVPQWNDQLRLTLRSLQKHLLCAPRNTSRLTVRTIHLLLMSGSSLPSWLQFQPSPGEDQHDIRCPEGTFSESHSVRLVVDTSIPTFNQFAIESHIAAIPSLSPHFIYFPSGTVFTRGVTVNDLFERGGNLSTKNEKNHKLSNWLIPRAMLPTQHVTPTATEKMSFAFARKGDLASEISTGATTAQRDNAPATAPLINSVHVVNTYLFTHYASGHAVVNSSTASLPLQELSREAQQKMSRVASSKIALASQLNSPLLLHDAALVQAFTLESEAMTRTLRHQTVQCWSSHDAIEAVKNVFASTNHSKGLPLTLRLMPALRHPFWMEQFLWEREALALSQGTEQLAEVMGLTKSALGYFACEKRGVRVQKQQILFPETRTYPEAQDPVSRFPCGPLRARLNSTSVPSPGVVNDLLRAEPETSPRQLPGWDSPQSNISASSATIASMQCWYPGRPLHAHANELPEVTAVPTLKERVSSWAHPTLDGHDDETSKQNTLKHHRLATVDMVYTYVKGDAPNWLKKLRETEQKMGIEKDDGRIRDWDELRYSLRSVKKFVCRDGDCCGQESGLGIGAIYIVMATEEHIPEWLMGYKVGTERMEEEREAMSEEDKLNCRPPLRIITHSMIFPGAGNNPHIGEHTKNPELQAQFLPTFNSHAIESCLHRIPGLRSHYMYLNNDFLFGRNVFVNDFFRPVVHHDKLMLEPLIAIEIGFGSLSDIRLGKVEKGLLTGEQELEAVLFESDPERYEGCSEWPIRRGVTESLQVEIYKYINQWTLTKHFNTMLIHDRLEGMEINRKHSHVAMLFHRDTVHKMLEVDFIDVTQRTRVGKFRDVDQVATEYMYIYYAAAHRRARGSHLDSAFCVGAESVQYPFNPVKDLYVRWNHFEDYEIDKRWGYHWFYQVHAENLQSYIDDVKSGQRPLTTFVSINDNFGRESDEKFEEHFKQFSELMNLLVSNAPISWFEEDKNANHKVSQSAQ